MTTLINGINYSAINVNNIAFGVPVTGITKISWSKKQTKDNNYGLAQDPISRGYGQNTYEGTMTVYKDWWQSVVNASPNKDPLQIPPFNWTITYGNPPQTPLVVETLKAFEFLEDGTSVNAGDTKILIDIPFVFAGIERV